MEDGLREGECWNSEKGDKVVLILVLMEDGLRVSQLKSLGVK